MVVLMAPRVLGEEAVLVELVYFAYVLIVD